MRSSAHWRRGPRSRLSNGIENPFLDDLPANPEHIEIKPAEEPTYLFHREFLDAAACLTYIQRHLCRVKGRELLGVQSRHLVDRI